MHLPIQRPPRLLPSLALCALALCSLALPAGAATTLVSTASQFNNAVAAASPGSVIVLRDGTWSGASLIANAQGTQASPVIIRAQTPGQVKLTGGSSLRIGGRWLVIEGLHFENNVPPGSYIVEFRYGSLEAQDCRLTETAFTGCNAPWPALDGPDPKRYFWVGLFGRRNRVDHCWFGDQDFWGVTVVVNPDEQPNYHQVDHNFIGDRPRPPDHIALAPPNGKGLGNGHEAIRIGTSTVLHVNSRTTVEYNLFDRASGEGEIVSNKSGENVNRYNTFRNSQGALTLRAGHRCHVEGNYFFEDPGANTRSGGVRIIGADHVVINNYCQGLTGTGLSSALCIMNGERPETFEQMSGGYQQVLRALVAFNTFVHCAPSFVLGSRAATYPDPPTDCIIANNTVLSAGATIMVPEGPMVNTTWQGNIMHGGALGMTQPSGIQMTNPGLAPGTDGIWRPQPGSPLIAAAAGSLPQVTHDVDQQPRTGPKDIGADQVLAGASSASPPLTRADVGPTWMRPQTAARGSEMYQPPATQ